VDLTLDAINVALLVAYVAPGFLATLGYRARYPAPERSAGYVLILSVVLSLPLVALANALVAGPNKPTRTDYALPLTVGSFVLGYVVALIRGLGGTKWLLARLGYDLQPENSIYLQTLAKIGGKERVQVEMKNGRHIRGIPGAGPAAQDDGINELYLTHPEGPLGDGSWQSLGGAAIVKLDEASVIVLAVDPTNKPPKTAPPVTQESQPPALEGVPTPTRNGVPPA
jgi:Family of unknown function (DUF6338)